MSKKEEITVAAASNLVFAFEEIGAAFEQQTGINIQFSFGSSGQLAQQISQGAPFDVFASADEAFLLPLEENGVIISETIQIFSQGTIGIATLPENKDKLNSLEDLQKQDFQKIAIASPEHAPYGKAAKEALETSGLWDELSEKIVYARNVSDALTYVETKNAEAAFLSLSLKKEHIHILPVDSSLHLPLYHTVAVVNKKNVEASNAFIEYLLSKDGQAILSSYGFKGPGE